MSMWDFGGAPYDDTQFQFPEFQDQGQMPQGDYMSGGGFGGDYGGYDGYSGQSGWGGMNVSGSGGGYPGVEQNYYDPGTGSGFEQAPSGQQTGSGASPTSRKDDEWKKLLMGLGTSAGSALIGAAGKALTGSGQKQQSTPWPTAPGQAYQTAPPIPEPGTKASPLISGRPKHTSISQGLEERMRRGGQTGGFSLY